MTKNESYDNQKKLIELLMDHCVSLDAYLDFTDVHQQAKYWNDYLLIWSAVSFL